MACPSSPTLTIASAADARYFRSLLQLLASLTRHVDTTACHIVVYDLGLSPRQRRQIAVRFPFVEQRTFDFSAYPEFVRIRQRAVNTNGWKPPIVQALVADASGQVLWLDSATVVCAPLDPMLAWTQRTGVYAPFGGTATIGELTHPAALAALGADDRIASLRQRASGVLCFDATRPRIRQLVARWAEACLDARVISPPGATLANHRFDQSALNVLLAQEPDLAQTDQELDISSDHPTPVFRARNKVHPMVPVWLDPLVRAWFKSYRAIDVALWRLKRRRAPAHTSVAQL